MLSQSLCMHEWIGKGTTSSGLHSFERRLMTTTFFSAGGDQSIKRDHRGKLMLYICGFFCRE